MPLCLFFSFSLFFLVTGVPHLNFKDSLQGLPNSPFFHFSHDLSYISAFFFMSNEIVFFPNFIYASKVSIIFTYESENNKIYPMWTMFY
jgi:hypothetical protein